MALDRFDRQLLNLIQHDSARTADELAATVALSASAIQRRLKRLRTDGVIRREAAVVNAQAVGHSTLFVVGLEVERERPEFLSRLRAWLNAEPEVQQVFYVTGETDFVLIVTSPSTAAFDDLMARLMAENANVRRFTTNVVLGLVKQSLAIPIPLEES